MFTCLKRVQLLHDWFGISAWPRQRRIQDFLRRGGGGGGGLVSTLGFQNRAWHVETLFKDVCAKCF